jgi:hypothetical protein
VQEIPYLEFGCIPQHRRLRGRTWVVQQLVSARKSVAVELRPCELERASSAITVERGCMFEPVAGCSF